MYFTALDREIVIYVIPLLNAKLKSKLHIVRKGTCVLTMTQDNAFDVTIVKFKTRRNNTTSMATFFKSKKNT